MFKKLSIRARLVGITMFTLIICCIGLTVIINYSAVQMTSQVAEILVPAKTLTLAENAQITDAASCIGSAGYDAPQPVELEKARQQEEVIGVFYKRSLVYMIFIIAFGGVMMYFFSKRILFPLAALNEKIKSSTISNLTDNIAVPDSHDEITELAVSFNKMTDRIHKSLIFQQQFSANVAHELRTPLTILKTKIEVFNKRDDCDVAAYRQLVSGLQNQIGRLSDIVQMLLELTNTDAVQDKEYVLVEDIAEDIITELSDISSKKNIQFSTDYKDAEMYGDIDMIYQVFYNLIQNSIKYNIEGGTVSVLAKNENKKTVICIRDTGTGISDENKVRIFDPFFCVDKSRSRAAGGVGLGLSIVRHIVDKHGGTIMVSDNRPQGTCFIIELPFLKQE